MSKAIKKSIGELFYSFVNGFAFKSDDFSIDSTEETLPVLKINNIGNSSTTDFTNCHYHKFAGYEKFIANCGDLAFSLTGSLGYVSVINSKCLVNQRVLVIKREVEYAKLLDLVQPLIRSLDFTNYCYSMATSEANKNISPKTILDYKITIYVNDDGTYDFEKQLELAKKYQEIEKQKRVLVNKAEELKKSKIIITSDSDIKYANVPITTLFTPKGGDMKLSKPYCKEHFGKYPVYSGSTSKEIFGSVDTYAYDGDYLTWVVDGLAGYVMKLTGQFSITCHRGILIPTKECKDIDLLYVKYMIEPIFRKRARGRIGINGKNEYTALKPTHIVNYNDSILIPIDEKGNYDLKKQQDLAMKYATIETIKENIYNQIYSLTNIVIN